MKTGKHHNKRGGQEAANAAKRSKHRDRDTRNKTMKWSDWSVPTIPAGKAEGSKAPDNPLLHRQLEGSLGCMKPVKKASVSIATAKPKSSADRRLANDNKV